MSILHVSLGQALIIWDKDVGALTVVYIDSLFTLNLILDYLLLLLTARLTGLPFSRKRLLAGAALGACYAVLAVLPQTRWMAAALLKCAVSVPITAIAFGWRRGGFIRRLILFWTLSFTLAGLALGFGLLFGHDARPTPYIHISVRALLLTAAAAYFVLTAAFKGFARYGGARSRIVPVRVSHNGKSAAFDALVDTGHTLSDPMTGQSVLVADLPCVMPILPGGARALVTADTLKEPIELIERLRLADAGLKLRLIPYRTVGSPNSLLLAFRPDAVTVCGRKSGPLLIGLSPTPISEGKPYGALVNLPTL
ncbi:MAG: sigma-E processing peptidase SpoIIGA [Oscillospiraceae bacterium]|nr:sigma-E processing peptidase SpoIIGA [Oscillospiraceae bacterium]